MSGKVKMRCARCGKQFKSASAKQTLCADCEIKERQARAASKVQGPKPTVAAAVVPPQQPKIIGPGAGILVPGLAPTPTPAEPEHIAFGAAAIQTERAAQQRPPSSAASAPPGRTPQEQHERHDKHDKHDKQERQGAAHAQQQRQPKAATRPKERKPASPPFVLTDELRAQIEQRYLELSQPVEFDGIRTRISEELSIPKSAVRRVVQDVRARLQMPSWWELQAFSGNDEDLARIRAAYEPLLPIPPVGIHKQLAISLGLEPIVVYHGIRRIRAEMRLPQYNPPELHAEPDGTGNAAAPASGQSNQSTAPAIPD